MESKRVIVKAETATGYDKSLLIAESVNTSGLSHLVWLLADNYLKEHPTHSAHVEQMDSSHDVREAA